MNKNFTKNSLLLLMLLIFCTAASLTAQEKEEDADGKNLVKWNAGELCINNL